MGRAAKFTKGKPSPRFAKKKKTPPPSLPSFASPTSSSSTYGAIVKTGRGKVSSGPSSTTRPIAARPKPTATPKKKETPPPSKKRDAKKKNDERNKNGPSSAPSSGRGAIAKRKEPKPKRTTKQTKEEKKKKKSDVHLAVGKKHVAAKHSFRDRHLATELGGGARGPGKKRKRSSSFEGRRGGGGFGFVRRPPSSDGCGGRRRSGGGPKFRVRLPPEGSTPWREDAPWHEAEVNPRFGGGGADGTGNGVDDGFTGTGNDGDGGGGGGERSIDVVPPADEEGQRENDDRMERQQGKSDPPPRRRDRHRRSSQTTVPLPTDSVPSRTLLELDDELRSFGSYVQLTRSERRARETLVGAIGDASCDLFDKGGDSSCDGGEKKKGKKRRRRSSTESGDVDDDKDNGGGVRAIPFGSYVAPEVCTFLSDVDVALWNVVDAPRGAEPFSAEPWDDDDDDDGGIGGTQCLSRSSLARTVEALGGGGGRSPPNNDEGDAEGGVDCGDDDAKRRKGKRRGVKDPEKVRKWREAIDRAADAAAGAIAVDDDDDDATRGADVQVQKESGASTGDDRDGDDRDGDCVDPEALFVIDREGSTKDNPVVLMSPSPTSSSKAVRLRPDPPDDLASKKGGVDNSDSGRTDLLLGGEGDPSNNAATTATSPFVVDRTPVSTSLNGAAPFVVDRTPCHTAPESIVKREIDKADRLLEKVAAVVEGKILEESSVDHFSKLPKEQWMELPDGSRVDRAGEAEAKATVGPRSVNETNGETENGPVIARRNVEGESDGADEGSLFVIDRRGANGPEGASTEEPRTPPAQAEESSAAEKRDGIERLTAATSTVVEEEPVVAHESPRPTPASTRRNGETEGSPNEADGDGDASSVVDGRKTDALGSDDDDDGGGKKEAGDGDGAEEAFETVPKGVEGGDAEGGDAAAAAAAAVVAPEDGDVIEEEEKKEEPSGTFSSSNPSRPMIVAVDDEVDDVVNRASGSVDATTESLDAAAPAVAEGASPSSPSPLPERKGDGGDRSAAAVAEADDEASARPSPTAATATAEAGNGGDAVDGSAADDGGGGENDPILLPPGSDDGGMTAAAVEVGSSAARPLAIDDDGDDHEGGDASAAAAAAEESDDDSADKMESYRRRPSTERPSSDSAGAGGPFVVDLTSSTCDDSDVDDNGNGNGNIGGGGDSAFPSTTSVRTHVATESPDDDDDDGSNLEVSFVSNPPSAAVAVAGKKRGRSASVGPTGKTRKKVVAALSSLGRELRRCPWVHTVEVRRRARVPIVTVSTILGFEADVALGGHNGTDTSRYARSQVRRYRSFATVVLLLKVLLQQTDLDKPFTGGLGSYKLYVLVSHHLEKHLSLGGSDRPSEVLLSFLFRYGDGGIAAVRGGVAHPSTVTKLSADVTLRSGDGGSADLSPVFKVAHCAELFGACFRRLMERMRPECGEEERIGGAGGGGDVSFLGCIVDAARLSHEREECLRKSALLGRYDRNGGGGERGRGRSSVGFDRPGKVAPGRRRNVGRVFAKGGDGDGAESSQKRRQRTTSSSSSAPASPRTSTVRVPTDEEDDEEEAEKLMAGYGMRRGPRGSLVPKVRPDLDAKRSDRASRSSVELLRRASKNRKSKGKQKRDAAVVNFARRSLPDYR